MVVAEISIPTEVAASVSLLSLTALALTCQTALAQIGPLLAQRRRVYIPLFPTLGLPLLVDDALQRGDPRHVISGLRRDDLPFIQEISRHLPSLVATHWRDVFPGDSLKCLQYIITHQVMKPAAIQWNSVVLHALQCGAVACLAYIVDDLGYLLNERWAMLRGWDPEVGVHSSVEMIKFLWERVDDREWFHSSVRQCVAKGTVGDLFLTKSIPFDREEALSQVIACEVGPLVVARLHRECNIKITYSHIKTAAVCREEDVQSYLRKHYEEEQTDVY